MSENQLILLIISVTAIYILVIIFIIRKFRVKVRKDKDGEGNKKINIYNKALDCEVIPRNLSGSTEKNNYYKMYLNRKYPQLKLIKYNKSQCWKCKSPTDGYMNIKCPKCKDYVCNNCGSCGLKCDHGQVILDDFNNEIRMLLELDDSSAIKKRFLNLDEIRQKQVDFVENYNCEEEIFLFNKLVDIVSNNDSDDISREMKQMEENKKFIT